MTFPFLNFNGATVEVWEWISNFIPHYTVYVITYPYWDQSQSMLVKGATGVIHSRSMNNKANLRDLKAATGL